MGTIRESRMPANSLGAIGYRPSAADAATAASSAAPSRIRMEGYGSFCRFRCTPMVSPTSRSKIKNKLSPPETACCTQKKRPKYIPARCGIVSFSNTESCAVSSAARGPQREAWPKTPSGCRRVDGSETNMELLALVH